MKKINIILLFFALANSYNSQEKKEIENSIFSIQTGVAGFWINNEAKIHNNIVLRSEIGLSAGFWAGSYYDNLGFILTPLLRLEPKYYYNVERRLSKEKNIDNNAANFVSIKSTFHPNWFTISNYKNMKIISDVSVIPTYGLRRSINKHLNYEFSFGLGFRYLYLKDAGYIENKTELAPDITFRLGYTF